VHKCFAVGEQPAAVFYAGVIEFFQLAHYGGYVCLVYGRKLRGGGVLYSYYFHEVGLGWFSPIKVGAKTQTRNPQS